MAPPIDADTPIVHPAYARRLCDLLQREGVDAAAVLAQVGLRPAGLHDGAPMLSLAVLRWLVLAAERASKRVALGLEAGAQMDLSSHGRLGDALAACANLRAALQLMAELMPLRARLATPSLQPEPGGLCYCITPALALGDVRRFLLEHMAAGQSRMMREVSGSTLAGARIDLPWPRPPWHAGVRHHHPSARYDAPALAWHLPDALLDRPNPRADAAACAAALQHCRAGLAASRSLTRQLQQWLEHSAPASWTLAQAAQGLGLSPRTLMRRLQAEGQDFRSLVDALRSARALAWLRDGARPVAQIALDLGYRSASNFSRSCRRWHGRNPAELRAGALHEAADRHSVT